MRWHVPHLVRFPRHQIGPWFDLHDPKTVKTTNHAVWPQKQATSGHSEYFLVLEALCLITYEYKKKKKKKKRRVYNYVLYYVMKKKDIIKISSGQWTILCYKMGRSMLCSIIESIIHHVPFNLGFSILIIHVLYFALLFFVRFTIPRLFRIFTFFARIVILLFSWTMIPKLVRQFGKQWYKLISLSVIWQKKKKKKKKKRRKRNIRIFSGSLR